MALVALPIIGIVYLILASSNLAKFAENLPIEANTKTGIDGRLKQQPRS